METKFGEFQTQWTPIYTFNLDIAQHLYKHNPFTAKHRLIKN